MQKYTTVQQNDLHKIFIIVRRIEKKRNKVNRKLNEVKTIICFLQNDLTKQQQNQFSIY